MNKAYNLVFFLFKKTNYTKLIFTKLIVKYEAKRGETVTDGCTLLELISIPANQTGK